MSKRRNNNINHNENFYENFKKSFTFTDIMEQGIKRLNIKFKT